MKNKFSMILLTLILFFIFPATVVGAEQNVEHLLVENNNQIIEVNENLQLKINNQEFVSTLEIIINNKTVYSRNIDFAYYRSFYYFEKDNIGYILTEEKHTGTASALTFSLLKIEDKHVQLIQESNEYIKGLINLTNDLQLHIIYPKYKEGDSNATPSFIYQDTFTFNENGFEKESSIDITETKKSAQVQEKQNRIMTFSIQSTTKKGTNPTPAEINKLLSRKAIENGIPPEILKAIAWQESRWRQFNDSTGEPLIGGDGIGIGIMQVSDYIFLDNPDEEYINRLKYDIEFNIDEGIKILLNKWNYGGNPNLIPTVNDNDKSVIENWYFALLAYNGILQRNDPILYPLSKGPSLAAYQELIFDHIRKKGLVDVSFPVNILKGEIYYKDDKGRGSRMYFKKNNYQISGKSHTSNHLFKNGDIVNVVSPNATLRISPNGGHSIKLELHDLLEITGDKLYYDNDKNHHYVWYKVRNIKDNNEYYVQAPYINKLSITNFNRTDLQGTDRYRTGIAISKYGWKNTSDVVVLARGDNPIDGLTGSVLASKHNAPLLLIHNDRLSDDILKEIKRLNPKMIYLLGGSHAISKSVEQQLISQFGKDSVNRLSGSGRYATAAEIAEEIGIFDEIFIVTDDESSPDSLSIGSVAGQKQAPILYSSKEGLTYSSLKIIRQNKNAKVYIIGGENAVPEKVRDQLQEIGISKEKVKRIAGTDRYRTSVAIAREFPTEMKSIVFVSGERFIDALPGSPLAAKILEAPIILVKPDRLNYPVEHWLNTDVNNKFPKIYYLGGEAAISQSTRAEILKTVINNYVY